MHAGEPTQVTVVGVGAGGWAELTHAARAAVENAEVLIGSARQLDLVRGDAERVTWPSPLLPQLDGLFAQHADRRICVLASGDPLLSGIGTTLVRRFGADAVRVLPTTSSVTLARARLGWSFEETEVVSAVGRNVHRITRALAPGRRVLVLSSDGSTPAEVASLLSARGYGPSELTVLENLGHPDEHRRTGVAQRWSHQVCAPLNVVAIACIPAEHTPLLAAVPGLPDDAFENDGQLTKRDLRASALARLAPVPGQLLWDVGAGAGSVAIEWLRTHPANRAVAFERSAERGERISRNAERLGVPELEVVQGEAPDCLTRNENPDAIFVGGGVSSPGMLKACLDALAPGGRLVAHAVTLESEAVLTHAYTEHGGELTRIAVEHAGPLGGLTGWQPARTVTQWAVGPLPYPNTSREKSS